MHKRWWLFALFAALLWWSGVSAPAAIPTDGTAAIPEEKFVALTFDDGPRADTTGQLLDGLRERGASATFFLIGEQIADNAGLVQRMRDEGHQVGNHTWSHMKLQGADRATVEEEVGRTDALLRELLGEGTYWVRPPYGLINDDQRAWFTTPLVHWEVDPEDWRRKNADADVAAVLSCVEPGDIILMHDSIPASVEAALRIVDVLEAEGYSFVTVEELFALGGVQPENGVLYHAIDHAT